MSLILAHLIDFLQVYLQIHRMSVGSCNTVCLYEDLWPRMRQGQLQASDKFTSENFYSQLNFVKLKAEWT